MKYASSYPEVEGELQGKDGDAFVVKGASHRAGDVTRDNGNEACCKQPRSPVPQLPCQQKGGDGGQPAKYRGQEHTHIPDVDSDVQEVEDIVDEACCGHKAWVHLEDDEKQKGRRGQKLFRLFSERATQISFAYSFYMSTVINEV